MLPTSPSDRYSRGSQRLLRVSVSIVAELVLALAGMVGLITNLA